MASKGESVKTEVKVSIKINNKDKITKICCDLCTFTSIISYCMR